MSVVAGEGLDHAARVRLPAQGERGEVERRRPALRPYLEQLDVALGQVEAESVVQERPRFGVAETQLARAEFCQLAPCAKPGERKRWILACGDDNVERPRQVLDQIGDPLVDVVIRDQVVVVEHKRELLLHGRQLIEQGCERRSTRRAVRGRRERDEVGLDGSQRGNDVEEEADGIVVVVIERQPRDAGRPIGGPGREQGGLAEAGWGDEDGERAGCALLERLDQIASGHVLGADGRPRELRLEDDRTRRGGAI